MKMKQILSFTLSLAMLAGSFSVIPTVHAADFQAVTVKQVLADSTLIPSGAMYTIMNLKSNKLLNADEDGNVCQRGFGN